MASQEFRSHGCNVMLRTLNPRTLRQSPVAVAALVMLFYLLWLGLALPDGRGAITFTGMGAEFIDQSTKGPLILAAAASEGRSIVKVGYDGQFAFYIALDPENARYHMIVPAYRYSRILYPLLARLVAGADPQRIPYALIYINLIAIAGGTLAVAMWLKIKCKSPWLALIYGFYPGLFISLHNDLTEPLAYAFAAVGVLLLTFRSRQSRMAASIAFACAILTRESTAVFPVLLGLSLVPWHDLRRQCWRASSRYLGEAGAIAVLPLAPYLLYKLFLIHWLGSSGIPHELFPTPLPFQGIYHYYPLDVDHQMQLKFVVVPATICALVCLYAIARGSRSITIFLLLANALAFAVFLNPSSFESIAASSRIATGIILAALYALPELDEALALNRAWLWFCSMLWLPLILFWLILPVINSYVGMAVLG